MSKYEKAYHKYTSNSKGEDHVPQKDSSRSSSKGGSSDRSEEVEEAKMALLPDQMPGSAKVGEVFYVVVTR